MFYLLATCWQRVRAWAIPMRERDAGSTARKSGWRCDLERSCSETTGRYPTKIGLGIPRQAERL